MPSTNRITAVPCASVGQRPSNQKEYSRENSVSLTISCPHRLAERRRLAMFQKIVASQEEPNPESRHNAAKVVKCGRAISSASGDPTASARTSAPTPVVTPSQFAQSVASTSGFFFSHDALKTPNAVQLSIETVARAIPRQ